MQLRDDVDVSTINWTEQAHLTRRNAENLPPGARRQAEIDRALACEALAHSGDLLLQTQAD
jgi:ABC-type branched-subunit amino acid transport system ATPase component